MTSRRTTPRKRPSTTSDHVWKPRNYMKVAVRWLLAHAEAALFMQPGLGKTSCVLEALRLLMKHGGVGKVLIIAPLRVCYAVWSHGDGELGKWSNFSHLRVALLHGRKREQALNQDADLYVVNPEGLQWLIGSGSMTRLLQAGVDTLVIDELSKFKHPRTKRAKLLKPLLDRFKRRWGLTGSPRANSLLNLFGQVYMLDQGRRLGKFISHFRFKYFDPTGYHGYVWVPKAGGEQAIYKKLKDIALSMRAEDHLDLPALVEQNIYVDLPAAARHMYDELEEELITLIDDDTVTAANRAVALMKCRQVASGGIYVDRTESDLLTGRRTKHLHEAKTEALMDLVDELQGSPLLVIYEFQHDLERILRAFPKKEQPPVIGGGTNMKDSLAFAKRWNAGQLQVLVGHPQAMGHGLNLQGAGHHQLWYTPTQDYELYDQTVRRQWRQGNLHDRCFVQRLVARRTTDEDVIKLLAAKGRGEASLFNALRSRVRRRAKT